jgi:hydrogenase maturation protein HypF
MSGRPAPDALALAGSLSLVVGAISPIQGGRPVLSAGLLDRLASRYSIDQWPEQLGRLFNLCGHAQTLASQLALQGTGSTESSGVMTARIGLLLRLVTAGEQLQRMVLDWPSACPQPGLAPDMALLKAARPATPPAQASLAELQHQMDTLSTLLAERLFGMPAADWLREWQTQPVAWLHHWSQDSHSSVARWLHAIRPDACAVRLAHRVLPTPQTDPAGFADLGQRLLNDPAQSQRPSWHGLAAETGPCTRGWQGGGAPGDESLWWRLGARVADLAAILSRPDSLRFGSLTLGLDTGLGWCEMSRGLLVHVAQVQRPTPEAAPTITRYRLQAPTEWNFHPDGALAQWLRQTPPTIDGLRRARLAATALDPCVQLDVQSAAEPPQSTSGQMTGTVPWAAPSPSAQTLPRALPACVLALGAHLKNKACLVAGAQVFWSDAHGDLADVQACTNLQASVDRVLALARAQGHAIQAVAHDLHPDFFSTRLALQTAERLGVPAIPVQHHHAHVAVLLAEAGLTHATTGLALDGYGMGSDGTAWGGELLRVDTTGWQRLGRLSPLALPGGDRAALEPWRMAAAALHALGRGGEIVPRWSAAVGEPAARTIATMLERDVRCPLTSSAGRWFDAAAAALGLCLRQSHEAEAAIALQQCAQAWLDRQPPGDLPDLDAVTRHRLGPESELVLLGLLEPLLALGDPAAKRDDDAIGRAAAQFHISLASALTDWVCRTMPADPEPFVVALSGGCFHNGLLRDHVQRKLAQRGGATVTTTEPGDATLALGQAWVAAWHLANGCASTMADLNAP